MNNKLCINIEGVNNICDTNNPQFNDIYQILPRDTVDVYLPGWPLYIRRLTSFEANRYATYYVQYNPQSGTIRRITVYQPLREHFQDLVSDTNEEYLKVVAMVRHPQFNEYLGQLEISSNINNYIKEFNTAFGLSSK